MKKYPKYKSSNIDWIGDIPEHWDIIKLKYLGKTLIGITYSPDNVVNEENGILVLRSSNIQEGYLDFNDCIYVDKNFDKKYYVQEGDILLCARNGSAHLVGKSAYIEKINKEITFGAFMTIVRSDLRKYLYYFFNSQVFKSQTGLFSTSTINQLTSDTLNNMFISFPKDLEEQTQIINYLEKKILQIDNLIEEKKQLIQLFEEEKITLISRFTSIGLDPKIEMVNSGVEWMGKIPKHWEIKKLKYLSKVQTGRTPKIQASNVDFFENGTINWFTPSDFKSNKEVFKSKRRITEEAILKNEVELFPEKSIYLVSIGATLGKISYCSTKASANQQINVISFNDKILNPMFGYYYLIGCKKILLLEADYTTLPILNQTKTKNLFLVVPPIKEQEKIVNHIELESKRIDFKIKKTNKLIDLLTEYRSALISEVVTGKVKITD